jgi:hypothetical protein
MQLKPFKSSALLISMVVFVTLEAYSQEKSGFGMEPEGGSHEERFVAPPPESETKPAPKPNNSFVCDSAVQTKVIKTGSRVLDNPKVIEPAKSIEPVLKPVEKTTKKEDPLSFNFLYYIIERFKMSDMIE